MQEEGEGGAGANFDIQKRKTVKFVKEHVVDIDERDKEVWEILTDVPKLSTPWNYIAFCFNVLIPGK